MSDIKREHQTEQAEAIQAQVTKEYELFKSTLSDPQKEAALRLEEFMKWSTENHITVISFIKLAEGGFHQFNNLLTSLDISCDDPKWEDQRRILGMKITNAMAAFLSGSEGVYRILIVNAKTNTVVLDTHPPKCDF